MLRNRGQGARRWLDVMVMRKMWMTLVVKIALGRMKMMMVVVNISWVRHSAVK